MNKGKQIRRFTAEEDQFILDHIGEMSGRALARAMGRDLSTMGSRIKILEERGDLVRPRRGMPWTDEEDETLLHYVRQEDIERTARRLGRSVQACHIRLRRYILGEPVLDCLVPPDALRVADVARLFQVSEGAVWHWLRAGVLKRSRFGLAKRPAGKTFLVPDEIRRFLREHPECYQVKLILPGPFRRYAERIAEEERENPWITAEQAANLKGCAVCTVWKAALKGKLPARKIGKGPRSPWLIRRADVLAWQVDREAQRYSRIGNEPRRRKAA